MAKSFAEYSPGSVFVTVGGIPMSGFSNNSMVKFMYREDAFSDDVGAQGDFVRVQNLNTSAEVEISLLQTSPSNDVLNAMAFQDRHFGLGVRDIQIKDLRGTTVFAAPFAYVQKVAEGEFAKGSTDRVWKLTCASAEINVGGAATIL